MQTVRTTVTLPQNVYQQIRAVSYQQNRSYGDILAELFVKYGANIISPNKSSDEVLAIFREAGKSGKKIDLLKALREDRDR